MLLLSVLSPWRWSMSQSFISWFSLNLTLMRRNLIQWQSTKLFVVILLFFSPNECCYIENMHIRWILGLARTLRSWRESSFVELWFIKSPIISWCWYSHICFDEHFIDVILYWKIWSDGMICMDLCLVAVVVLRAVISIFYVVLDIMRIDKCCWFYIFWTHIDLIPYCHVDTMVVYMTFAIIHCR